MTKSNPAFSHPLISVVMATYNGERYLREQLDSILAQTYPNIEIIVVDDNSTDSTPKILEEYANLHAIIFFRNPQNLGVTANFEKGMRLAKGDLIALSDQDDVWESNKLELLLAHLGNNTLAYADSILIDSEGTPIGQTLHQRLKIQPIEGKPDRSFYFLNCIPGHAMLFDRSLLAVALPLPKHTMYDQWLAFAASRLNGIAYLPRPLVYYRQHAQSVMNALRQKKLEQLRLRHHANRRKAKIAQRKASAINKANSLLDFANSGLTRKEDRELLRSIAKEYMKFDQTFFNKDLFKALYRNRADFFRISKRKDIVNCLREALGAKAIRIFLVS